MCKTKILSFLLLATFLLCTVSGTQHTDAEPEQTSCVKQTKIHAPIHISGDAEFASLAQENGWPGNGSIENPYMIEGYEIDGNGGSYCILIENTDVYFVIRNCSLHNATTGSFPNGSAIALYNVHNATITNNTLSKNRDSGISLFLSTGNTITCNNLSDNSYGIYLYLSLNNSITNNLVRQNFYGLYLASSGMNCIEGNNVSENFRYGLCLFLGACIVKEREITGVFSNPAI